MITSCIMRHSKEPCWIWTLYKASTVALYRCTTPVLFCGHRRSPPLLERSWERPNAGNEISASEAVAVPRNAVTAGVVDSYESRNTKQNIPKFYQYIKIDACYGFTLLIQIVIPSFPHFLAISFDSDFHRAGSGNVDVMSAFQPLLCSDVRKIWTL